MARGFAATGRIVRMKGGFIKQPRHIQQNLKLPFPKVAGISDSFLVKMVGKNAR